MNRISIMRMKGVNMKRTKRVGSVVVVTVALAAMTTAAVALARTIVAVQYRGWTTQQFVQNQQPAMLHKPIAIVIDRTHQRVAYIGLAYTCSATSAGWVAKTYPDVKINRKGNFVYRPKQIHMTYIAGHVTRTRITGTFTANRSGCRQVKGTYSLVLGSKRPPEPSP